MKNYILDCDILSEKELQNLNGGWLALTIAIAGAVIYVYNNKDDFVEGFKEGFAK